MTAQADLKETVTQYLNYKTVGHFFNQMGSSLTNHLTPNEYQAYLQVITWAVLDRLKAQSFTSPGIQISEDNVTPIVDRAIRDICIVQQDLSYPDCMPSFLMSRVIWWSMKLVGRDLE